MDRSAAERRAGDDQLARAFEQGRPGAGARLYDHLLPVVDAVLVRVIGRREHDHGDLVQAAFEQIVTTLSKRTFGHSCGLTGWAAVIAYHVGLNALRSRRRERIVFDRETALEAEEVFDAHSSPDLLSGVHAEDHLRARDDLAAVRRQLAQMNPNRVMAMLLNAQGHSLTEIAGLTHVSVAAAQSRLSRGRRELKARLQAAGAGDRLPSTEEVVVSDNRLGRSGHGTLRGQ